MNTIKPGKFISIEGIEGAGKSTALQTIKKHLAQEGIDAVITREPGGTDIAERIRHLLLEHHEEKMHAETEVLLMFASRIQHVKTKILPALKKGLWVVTDRFFDASYAYQGSARGLGFERIKELQQWTLGDFEPDMTLLLDVPLDISLERVRSRKHLDRIELEEEAFFRNVREMYLHLSDLYSERYRVINSSRSRGTVGRVITGHIDSLISEPAK